MNRTGTYLVIRFVMTFIAAAIAFYFLISNSWSWILAVSVVAMAVNYGVGDMAILPSYGNIVAAIADGVMAGLVAYIISLLFTAFDTTFSTLLAFGVLIAVGEYFLHQYLGKTEKTES